MDSYTRFRLRLPIAFVAILLLFCACSHKQAAEPGRPLVVAMDASFPPMEFIDDDGKIVGFDADLMQAIAAAADLKIEMKNVAWDGIFGALKAGDAEVIASSVTITPARESQFSFTKPYLKAGQVLLVRSEDKARITSIDQLKGKRVGVQIATTGADFVASAPVEMKQYNTAGLAIIDLANGNLEAVVIDKPVADFYASKKPEFANKLAVSGEPATTEQFGLVVRKDSSELLAKLNAALDKIRSDGTYAKLEQKWFR